MKENLKPHYHDFQNKIETWNTIFKKIKFRSKSIIRLSEVKWSDAMPVCIRRNLSIGQIWQNAGELWRFARFQTENSIRRFKTENSRNHKTALAGFKQKTAGIILEPSWHWCVTKMHLDKQGRCLILFTAHNVFVFFVFGDICMF